MTDDPVREWELKAREVDGRIQIYRDVESAVTSSYVVVATLPMAHLPVTRQTASLIVAAPDLLRVCQDVLRETTEKDGTPEEIMERMLQVVMEAQGM